jgi:hypothetical protein
MAISHQKKTVIKVDFEAGLLTKSDIANKHKLTRSTIYKIAASEGWVYGKNRTEIDKATENRSLDKIINKQVDLATQITTNFLEDIEKYRKLSLMPASELASAYNEASKSDPVKKKKLKVTKEEFSRIWESAKAIKTAIEALKLGYEGARKALGMDREDKQKENDANDPTKGMTREDVQERIKQLRNK